jgi:hypothetical protein
VSTLSLDPGLSGCGLAYFDDCRILEAARYVPDGLTKQGRKISTRSERIESMVGALREARRDWIAHEVVTECPQIYTAGKGKGNPNLLIPLAQIGAVFASQCIGANWIEVLPHGWKGGLDPDAMIERIKRRLSREETARVESFKRGGLDHNIWDAIGIGLWRTGRLEPRRIFAR